MGRDRLIQLEQRIRQLEDMNDLLIRGDPSIALGTDLYSLGEVPACGLRRTANQSISTASWTDVDFNDITFDTNSMADLSANTINIPSDGIYLFIASAGWASNTTGRRGVEILLASGTHIIANTFVQTTSGGGGSNISCSGIRVFLKSVKSEDGFVTMRVYQDTGGNLNLLGSSGTVRQHTANFTVVKVAEVGQL